MRFTLRARSKQTMLGMNKIVPIGSSCHIDFLKPIVLKVPDDGRCKKMITRVAVTALL